MELRILEWVHNTFHSQIWLNYIMKYISLLGEFGAICIATCIVLLIFKKTRRSGFALALALAIDVVVVNLILKNAIGRARPWTHLSWAEQFFEDFGIEKSTDYSFPSGHTAVTFCAAALLVMFYKVKAIPAFVVAFLIGLSRIYLCEHYPTDVLAGMIIGSACGIGAYFAYKYGEPVALKILDKLLIKFKLKKSAAAESNTENLKADGAVKQADEIGEQSAEIKCVNCQPENVDVNSAAAKDCADIQPCADDKLSCGAETEIKIKDNDKTKA